MGMLEDIKKAINEDESADLIDAIQKKLDSLQEGEREAYIRENRSFICAAMEIYKERAHDILKGG